MPSSLSKVLVHLVFSTKRRVPSLANDEIRREMHAYLGGVCKGMDSRVLIVGGTADHVHMLFALSKNYPIAKIVGEIKARSSKWVKSKGGLLTRFAWQTGYGIFSVGQWDAERVREYIRNQEGHHRKRTFQDEYRKALKDNHIVCDERYLWD